MRAHCIEPILYRAVIILTDRRGRTQTHYRGPYERERDAKGAATRLKNYWTYGTYEATSYVERTTHPIEWETVE